MAQKTVVHLTDDVDGSRISGSGETVTFALDGVRYQIDLSETNAAKLRDVFAPYVAAARRGQRRGVRARRPASAPAKPRNAHGIREWARRNGFEISERGRISTSVLSAYAASSNGS
jgi:hypothetical protein